MKANDFCNLPLDERTNYLWDNGVCLNQRLVENKYIICIFSLDSFYVEAIYSRENNKVNTIRAVDGLIKWESYVDCVIRQLCSQS